MSEHTRPVSSELQAPAAEPDSPTLHLVQGGTTVDPPPENAGPGGAPSRPSGHSSRWWLAVAAAVVLGLAIWLVTAQSGKASRPAATPHAGPAIPVLGAKAREGDIGVYFTGLGAVTPLYTTTVRTRVDGQLMQVFYREGQLVHEGELLAQIDPRPFEVQLTQAEGQLIKDQAALENARIDLKRYQALITHNAVAQQQLVTQQALVVQDEGAVKTDQGNIDSAKLNLVYCRITSPITGRVGLRLVDPGNIVHATDTNGLMVITQITPISVIFTLPEDQVPAVLKRVRAGEKLRVDAWDRDLKTKLAEGQLLTLDNQIDPTTGTLKLRALFPNENEDLFPNEFVNARMLVREEHGATLVPNAAVQRNSQNTFVYLVKPDHTVAIQQVNVGATEGEDTQILSGISPGDIVVTTGVDKLQEGVQVNAQLGGPPRIAQGSGP